MRDVGSVVGDWGRSSLASRAERHETAISPSYHQQRTSQSHPSADDKPPPQRHPQLEAVLLRKPCAKNLKTAPEVLSPQYTLFFDASSTGRCYIISVLTLLTVADLYRPCFSLLYPAAYGPLVRTHMCPRRSCSSKRDAAENFGVWGRGQNGGTPTHQTLFTCCVLFRCQSHSEVAQSCLRRRRFPSALEVQQM
jgi:hypothetical protein